MWRMYGEMSLQSDIQERIRTGDTPLRFIVKKRGMSRFREGEGTHLLLDRGMSHF